MLAVTLAVGGLMATAARQASAQDYITAVSVFLRGTASKTGIKRATLAPGDSLFTRTVAPKPGWLPVRTMDGRTGWVGEATVRSLAAIAASAATAVLTAPGGAAFTRIDSTWAKPPIERSTIRVQDGALGCGPIGNDAKDDGTNLNKNRADIPSSSHLVTVEAIRSLPDTALWRFAGRKKWTRPDSALVFPYEGIPLTVEGFFEVVKPQNKKPGESPNCNSWLELDTDWHVALVADPSETEDRGVVVEPTPRTKRNNVGWDAKAVGRFAVRRNREAPRIESNAERVRVTGFLMLDPVHPDHIAGKCVGAACATRKFYRATLWEIHPVTRIEVFRGGQWVNLNDLPPPPP